MLLTLMILHVMVTILSNLFSSPYTLQSDLSIEGKFISSSELVCKGMYVFPININSHYYVLQKTKSINTIVSLRTIINNNINIICYYYNNVLPPCLRSI